MCGGNGHGVSAAARLIEQATRENHRHLHESAALGIERLLHEDLAEAWEECRVPNWDGHDAMPVSKEALRAMYTFIEALPLGIRPPTVGATPDGCLSVEWYRNPRRVLSVSIDEEGFLHYAALLGPSKACGTEAFYGDVPEPICDLIGRVYA